jgi:ADP-ribosylglycohydrolase
MTSTTADSPNHSLLNQLLAEGSIDIQAGALFESDPAPLPREFSFSKVEGMLLGLAVGDALGITSEGLLPADRRQLFGEIRDYRPNRYTGKKEGYPSDDTQLAFWALEQMIEDGGLDPDHVAARFCQGRIFGLGSTVRGFLKSYKGGTRPWWKCGPQSAGNGALMRIAPMVVPHLREPSPELWVDTALCAAITHNDSASIAACVAFVSMLWELLGMTEAPEPQWWVDTYVRAARQLEHREDYQPRGGDYLGYRGSLWRFVDEEVPAAFERGLTALDACESWYSGAYLLETVPSALFILMRHADDAETAIVRAVNDTRDNDTIAAIVGAAVGALHGREALPDRWVEKLTGRTTDSDDGRVFELIDQARERCWESD